MESPNVQIQSTIDVYNIIAECKKKHISWKIEQKPGIHPEYRVLLKPLDFHFQQGSVAPDKAKHNDQDALEASRIGIKGLDVLQKYRVKGR